MRLIRAAMATMVLGAGAAVATGAGMPAGAVVVPTPVACYGSLRGHTLAQPIVGIAATPTTLGYWLVASDGGIFAFGDATFHGSMGGRPLAQPIVAMAATPTGGGGYWLLAADAGIFAFGDAPYLGGGPILMDPYAAQPITGFSAFAATSTGAGYSMASANGAFVLTFGDAQYLGLGYLAGDQSPLVGMTSITAVHAGSTVFTSGFWEALGDGVVFAVHDSPPPTNAQTC